MTSTEAADAREETIEVSLTGKSLLENPLLNKGSAFSEEERREFGLVGLVPPHVSTTEEQLTRTYASYKQKDADLERYIYLASLQDRNETLFYRLLQEHITEGRLREEQRVSIARPLSRPAVHFQRRHPGHRRSGACGVARRYGCDRIKDKQTADRDARGRLGRYRDKRSGLFCDGERGTRPARSEQESKSATAE